jgi:hypothetical protein
VNAFIVHPEKPPFKEIRDDDVRRPLLDPATGWYEPIIPAGTPNFPWPHNPGPEKRLDAIQLEMGEQRCTACHQLPELSIDFNSTYCLIVLTPAVTRDAETMPPQYAVPSGLPGSDPYGDWRLNYKKHYDAMLSQYCNQDPPATGGVIVTAVPHVDDREVISPIRVEGPIYACAESAEIVGAAPRAEVEVYWNGYPAGTYVATGDRLEIPLPGGVATNDIIAARQVVDGTGSEFDDELVVEYPYDVLPKPIIDPSTVYRCANSISVITTRGARLEVRKNGVVAEVTYPADDRAIMHPVPAPFQANDEFVVQASLCAKRSDPSEPVWAVEPPSPLRAPLLDPSQPFEGQEFVTVYGLDYGAFGKVYRTNPSLHLGDTCGAPWGVSCQFDLTNSALGRPLSLGESLSAESSLYCPSGAPTGTSSPPTGGGRPAILNPPARPYVLALSSRSVDRVSGARDLDRGRASG